MDDSIFKVMLGLMTTFLGWCYYGVQRNNNRHEKHDDRINLLERKSAVAEEQMKHVLDKMDEILDMGDRLSKNNSTILRTLARNSKK